MAKQKPLVSQHLKNISRETPEKYKNRPNNNLYYEPQACGEQMIRLPKGRAFAACAFFAQGADDGKKGVKGERRNLETL